MEIKLEGLGHIVLAAPVPNEVLTKAYPCFAESIDSTNNVLWLTSPAYPEVYDESEIRTFLLALLPYAKEGEIDFTMSFCSGDIPVYSPVHWGFSFRGGHLFRNFQGTGSYMASSCLDA